MTDKAETPYEMLGGQDAVIAIVQRFYDLVESEPAYAEMRAMHQNDLGEVRAGLTGFLTGWLGGPRDWFEKGGCVMSMHRPMDISPAVAEQWIDAMRCAIKDAPTLNFDVASKMSDVLAQMASGMINRANAPVRDETSAS